MASDFDNSPLEEDLFICKNIEENNDNFRVINLENNVGLSRARNIGMKAAKGDIVCFVDADDTISNQYVSTLKSAFASNKEIEVFLINKNLIYDSNYMNNFSNNDIEISFNNKYKSTPNKVFISGLGGCFIVLRKSFLDKYNLFFPENRKYAEDVYWIYLIFSYITKWGEIKKIIYNYSKYDLNSLTNSSGNICDRWIDIWEHIFEANKKMLSENYDTDNSIWISSFLLLSHNPKYFIFNKENRNYKKTESFILMNELLDKIKINRCQFLIERQNSYFIKSILNQIKNRIFDINFVRFFFLNYKKWCFKYE